MSADRVSADRMSADRMSADRRKTVRLRDIDVHYRVHDRECGAAGGGDVPAVVFVHGLGEDHTSWARQQRDLTASHRTYTYDLRGHGGSGLGDADGSLGQLRDDLIAFLREVSGPAVCVGFSLGGTVVLSAAAKEPGLVTRAVVLGTSTVVGRAAAEYYAERIGRVRSGDPQRIAEALREDTAAALAQKHDEGPGEEPDEVAAVTAQRVKAIGDGRGYANAARAMAGLRDQPLTPALADIRCPVDVIGAERDGFCPRKAADILLAGLKENPHITATYREIPGAGHLMNVDQPAAVTEQLRAALAVPSGPANRS